MPSSPNLVLGSFLPDATAYLSCQGEHVTHHVSMFSPRSSLKGSALISAFTIKTIQIFSFSFLICAWFFSRGRSNCAIGTWHSIPLSEVALGVV